MPISCNRLAYEGEHGDPNPPSIVLHGRSAWNPYRQASIAAVANPDAPVPTEDIARAILVLRGQRVILDRELAAIYGVSTGRLNEAVKRNAERFPADFMFQLTAQEIENLKSQFAISSWGGRRYRPFAFTEHGAIQAANVLNSPRASGTQAPPDWLHCRSRHQEVAVMSTEAMPRASAAKRWSRRRRWCDSGASRRRHSRRLAGAQHRMDCRGARLARERHLPAQRRLSAAAAGLRVAVCRPECRPTSKSRKASPTRDMSTRPYWMHLRGWNCIPVLPSFSTRIWSMRPAGVHSRKCKLTFVYLPLRK